MAVVEWDLVDKYFESTSFSDPPCYIGRICEGIGFYHQKDVYCVALQHHDPTDERQNLYGLCPQPHNMFSRGSPVHELRLETKEELIAIKAKRRPFVIVSMPPDQRASGVRQLGDEAYIGVPLYSFRPGEDEFKVRIAALEYNNLFYLPQEAPYLDVESFCRFDRIQFLHPAHITPGRARLNRVAWWKFSQWLRFYLTGRVDDTMLEYRSLMLTGNQQASGQP